MALCLCGCGEEARYTSTVARPRCYKRLARNYGQPVPLQRREARGSRWSVMCPCGRSIYTDDNLCSACRSRQPITVDLRAIARAVAPRDPYPLETTSADRVLAGPSPEETDRRRQLERGLKPTRCEQCGGRAYEEPPCLINGVEVVVVRCRVCDVRRCAACGERPARRRETTCARCWTKIQRGEMEMPTATKVEAKQCPYCKKEFRPRARTQITCGAEACKKAHISFLSSGPERKALGPGAPPVGRTYGKSAPLAAEGPRAALALPPEERDELLRRGAEEAAADGTYDQPASDGIYGDKPGFIIEAPDPILRAVLALEAVPREKWNAIMEVLDARHEARLASNRAEQLLQDLGVA